MAAGAMVATMNRQVKARIRARPPLSRLPFRLSPAACAPLLRPIALSAFAALLLAFSPLASAAENEDASAATPSATQILEQLRLNQTAQHRTLRGSLVNGASKLAFRLVLDGPVIKYQFTDPPPYTLVLRLGEKGAQLTEVTTGGSSKVPDTDFATPVRGSDITFEDVAMRFIYWPDSKVLGADSVATRACWKIELKPGPGDKTAYQSVIAWIDQSTGALINAKAYDAAGKVATDFKLIEPQMISGIWLPRKIRIQRMKDGRPLDSSPTYLMIDGILKE